MTISSALGGRALAVEVQSSGPAGPDRLFRLRRALEALLVPAVALALAAAAFSLFLLFLGKSPITFFELVWRRAFRSGVSVHKTRERAGPFLLSPPCLALPPPVSLVVVVGGGGAHAPALHPA